MRYIRSMRYLWFFLLFPLICPAQNQEFAKSVIENLCSEEMHGRGYVKNGCGLAAEYILKEISRIPGAHSFPGGFTKEFYFPVNVFPGDIQLSIDENRLPSDGSSFLVDPASPSFEGTYTVKRVDSAQVDQENFLTYFKRKNTRNTFLLIDPQALKNVKHQERLQWLQQNGPGFRGIIEICDKLTWSVSQTVARFPKVYILRKPEIQYIHEISLRIENDYQRGFTAQNIGAYIRGKSNADSFIVFTAHYDHLGQMGHDAIFPGANDNAGGVAMLLDLMRYYEIHQPEFSVAFLFFAGEEAGLVGSFNYCENPMFPLSQIKFLINLDLVTTGQDGMMVVNATAHPEFFEQITKINQTDSLLPLIKWRPNAPNSDHYPFTLKKIPSFFIYLMGPYPWYHDPQDEPRHLQLSHYNASFSLIRTFADKIMRTH